MEAGGSALRRLCLREVKRGFGQKLFLREKLLADAGWRQSRRMGLGRGRRRILRARSRRGFRGCRRREERRDNGGECFLRVRRKRSRLWRRRLMWTFKRRLRGEASWTARCRKGLRGCDRRRGLGLHGLQLCAKRGHFPNQILDFGGSGRRGASRVAGCRFRGLQKFSHRVLEVGGKDGRTRGEINAPKIRSGLRELNFDVKARAWIVALARDLSDDFSIRSRVAEKEELAGPNSDRKANDAAVREHERGGSGLFEEFALAGIARGACASSSYWHFVSDGASTEGRP